MAAECICAHIISQNMTVPRDHIAHVEMLTTGRVVVDMIERRPEVFDFLLMIVTSQVTCPDRFTPPPSWFSSGAIDMSRIRDAIAQVKPLVWREWQCVSDAELAGRVGRDAYMIARFTVLSCPLELHGVDKALTNGTSWQQFKVIWSDEVEQQWERLGAGTTPEYLYHGSRLSNWYSILRNGLKVMSGTVWMSAGAAYGPGIYCSNSLNISWGYSAGTGAIVIGVYEVWGASTFLKGNFGIAPVTSGIYVVPREDQLLLRYLIYLPVSRSVDINALDQMLSAELQNRGALKAASTRKKNTRVEARLRREIEILTTAGIQVTEWDTTRVCCRVDKNNIYIEIPAKYPFSAPSLLGSIDPDWNPKRTLLELIAPHL